MEFDFNINELFGYEDIVCIRDNVTPYKSYHETHKEMRRNMMKVIDKMGALSAQAQSLRTGITSGARLVASNHRLYVLKDSHSNGGKGAILGILKSGYKKLFLFDNQGIQRETTPMCVLDFYIHESRQRQGLGRRLFDHMLQRESVSVQHIAVDRPSHKFLSFLQKHYHLHSVGPQIFNFAIFEGFFINRPSVQVKRHDNQQWPPDGRPSSKPSSPKVSQNASVHSLPINPFRADSQTYRTSPNGLGVYSRHSTPCPSPRVTSCDTHTAPAPREPQENTARAITPPLLSRDGPPAAYRNHIATTSQPPSNHDMSQISHGIATMTTKDAKNKEVIRNKDTDVTASLQKPAGLDHATQQVTVTDPVSRSDKSNISTNSDVVTKLGRDLDPLTKPSSRSRDTDCDDTTKFSPQSELSFLTPYIPQARDTSWNIFGVPRTHVQHKSHQNRMS